MTDLTRPTLARRRTGDLGLRLVVNGEEIIARK